MSTSEDRGSDEDAAALPEPAPFNPAAFQALVARDPGRAGQILGVMRPRWKRAQAQATARYLAVDCGTETSVDTVLDHYDRLIALSTGNMTLVSQRPESKEPVPVVYEPELFDRLSANPTMLRELLNWLSPEQTEVQAAAQAVLLRRTRNLIVGVPTLLAAWRQLSDKGVL